jgi:hypothetical protein
VVLRDYSDINVRDGRALIEAKGLQGVARFDQADAFDRASLAAIDPKPTVGVVSGLYELFENNERSAVRWPAWPRPSRPAATWSTPASPGTRSWS